MIRKEIELKILQILEDEFEIENPGMDDNLKEKYEFDSIDAIELLGEIEGFLGSVLTHAEKKRSMDIRTFRQLIGYIEGLAKVRG